MASAQTTITGVAATSNGANVAWSNPSNAADGNTGTSANATFLTGVSDYLDFTLSGMPPATATAIGTISFTVTYAGATGF